MTKCGKTCEVYSRVVGYHRPIAHWNKGKKEEFKFRKVFSVAKSLNSKFGKARTLESFTQTEEILVRQNAEH